MGAAYSVEAITSSPVTIGDRRPVVSYLRADLEPVADALPQQQVDEPAQDASAPGTAEFGALSGPALFEAATIVEKLPPPPPLPRISEFAWPSAQEWLPPESDLHLKDVTV